MNCTGGIEHLLRISARARYGVLALVDLGQHATESFVRAQDIAERKDIPPKFLGQILAALVQAGVVTGRRGASGGYRLTQAPASLTMDRVLQILGAEPPSDRCIYGVERATCTLPQRLDKCDGIGPAESAATERLVNTSLADLCSGYGGGEAAYQI